MPPERARFFTTDEQATARALCAHLLATDEAAPFVAAIDARLADAPSVGWHHDAMPTDGVAWRVSLKALDDDAEATYGRHFTACDDAQRADLVDAVRCSPGATWHGLPGRWVWILWTRDACSAFFSHPRTVIDLRAPQPTPRGDRFTHRAARSPSATRPERTEP